MDLTFQVAGVSEHEVTEESGQLKHREMDPKVIQWPEVSSSLTYKTIYLLKRQLRLRMRKEMLDSLGERTFLHLFFPAHYPLSQVQQIKTGWFPSH